MDIKDLRYFLAIVEEGSISAAARKLHMAQPPLSQQLRQLEDELGVTLIERSKRQFRITDAGRHLQHRAGQITGLMELTIRELRDLRLGMLGTLTLGTIASAGEILLTGKIRAFHEAYPGIRYQIREGGSAEVMEMVRNGTVEIGVVRTPIAQEAFSFVTLPGEPMAAVMAPGLTPLSAVIHGPLALAGLPLMVHNRFSRMIETGCRKAGFEPHIICRTDDTRMLLEWAVEGMGVALLPRGMIGLTPEARLVVTVIHAPEWVTGTAVIWKQDGYLSTVARNFIRVLEDGLTAQPLY